MTSPLDLTPVAAHQVVRETRQAHRAALRDARLASYSAAGLLVAVGLFAVVDGPSIGSPIVILGSLLLHLVFKRRLQDAERKYWYAQMRSGLIDAIDEKQASDEPQVVDLRDRAEVIDLRDRTKGKGKRR